MTKENLKKLKKRGKERKNSDQRSYFVEKSIVTDNFMSFPW